MAADRAFANHLKVWRDGLRRFEFEAPDLRLPCETAEDALAALAGSGALRIDTMARFWDRPGLTLAEATNALVNGLAGNPNGFRFAVLGTPQGLQVMFGGVDAAALKAGFPGARIGEAMERPTAGLPHAVILTGPPCPDEKALPRLEPLCRALTGNDFLFSVTAAPLRSEGVERERNALERRLNTLQRLSAIPGGTMGQNRAAIEEIRTALEKELGRYRRALGAALWTVEACLYAATPADLQLGAQALAGTLAKARGALSEPLRVVAAAPRRYGDAPPERTPLSSGELAHLVQPPAEAFAGYRVAEEAIFAPLESPEGPGPRLALGRDFATNAAISVPIQDLAQHMFVAGLPGSGKTTTCFNILAQLDAEDIDYLVIEPAKTEYRALRAHPGLKRPPVVFTVGDESGVPLRLNPFAFPDYVPVSRHRDQLKGIFRAAFVLHPPMPEALDRCIDAIYVDRGWDLETGENPRVGEHAGARQFPTLDDLEAKIPEVVAELNYPAESRQIVEAGLLTRIRSLKAPGALAPMYNVRESVDLDFLFQLPCVMELEALDEREQKAFFLALVLARLQQHNAHVLKEGGSSKLRHVVVIEEAHRVLRDVGAGPGSEMAANPTAVVVEMFANLLKEMRSSGAAAIVVEQNPSDIAPAAIAVTAATIVHKLLSSTDTDLVARKLGLSEAQARAIASFQAGEAVVRSPSLRDAGRLKMNRPTAATPPPPTRADLRRAAERDGSLPPRDTRLRLDPGGRDALAAPPRHLRLAFLRLFNALRTYDPDRIEIDVERLGDAVLGFSQVCRSLSARIGPEEAVIIFRLLLDADMERRGARAGWRFIAVSGLVDLGADALEALLEDGGEWEDAVVDFALALDEGHRLIAAIGRPFTGCERCRHPCAHRFDMERAPVDGEGLREALREGDTAAFWRCASDAAAEAYPDGHPDLMLSGAYCGAVMQLAATGLAYRTQRQWIEAVAELAVPAPSATERIGR